MAEPPVATVESLQRLIEKEREEHQRELSRMRANWQLEKLSRAQWEERATIAEAKLHNILQALGIR
jgi:hypothetical protein